MSTTRPNPAQWLGYAFGRRLPNSMNAWVRNDLTGPHAAIRHVVRGAVPFVPIYAVFLFAFGGPWPIRVGMVGLSVILATLYSVSYMDQNRARRLQKHGLTPTTRTVRQQQSADDTRAEYEAIYGPRRSPQDVS